MEKFFLFFHPRDAHYWDFPGIDYLQVSISEWGKILSSTKVARSLGDFLYEITKNSKNLQNIKKSATIFSDLFFISKYVI